MKHSGQTVKRHFEHFDHSHFLRPQQASALSIPKGFMSYSVKRLFKINKDVIEVFIMLELSLTQYSEVED